MSKSLRFTTIIAAIFLLACNRASESPTPETENLQLTDSADSIAWFLADAYADYAINLMDSVPEEYAQNFNPELFAEGFTSVLETGIAHSGVQYGLQQGAQAHNRLMNIRSCGIPVDPQTFIAGFTKGIANLTPQDSTIAILDKLMVAVNSKIIANKRRSHKLTD